MASKNFFSRLFGIGNEPAEEEQNNRLDTSNTADETKDDVSIQDALNFVIELQSYYYNDICNMKTNLLLETSNSSKENFINKIIKQDENSLSQIDEIIRAIKDCEREFQKIWRKSVYSFFDEIENEKLVAVKKEVFKILLRLYAINSKEELISIIHSRIEKYKENWKISEEFAIPQNCNPLIVDYNEGIEKYKFGSYFKNVIEDANARSLNSERLEKLRNLHFEIEEPISTDTVWLHISSVTRVQLNMMRRTCFFDNDWEYVPGQKNDLWLDIVNVNELENYLRVLLQIILTKRNHAVISIIIPTNEMKQIIGPTEILENKVKICKKYRFYLKERSGIYKNNLLTARIDRRNIPETLYIIPYVMFRKEYF